MLDFERNVVQLFDSQQIDFDFNDDEHLLESDALNIYFVPIYSLVEFIAPSKLPFQEIKTIRIWEDEYLHHNEIIDSRILSLIGISRRVYARQTEIKTIDKEALKAFLIKNHLNVPTSGKHRYGLYHQQEVVAVAAFSRSCPIHERDKIYRSHELIRYCSLLNTTVVGGLSKLINHFEKDKKPEHLMTYVDREWSDGRNYQNLGFKIVATTNERMFWYSADKNERILDKSLFSKQFDNKSGSKEWRQISTLGNIKLVKHLK